MLLSWGDFQFSVDTAAFDELELSMEYPWSRVDRLGNTPQLQATGKEHRTVSIQGCVFPAYRGGAEQIERLATLAGKMEPQSLVSGDGRNLGRWCLMSISETDTDMLSDGTPRKQAYTLQLERFDAK